MASPRMKRLERRIFLIGLWLVAAGSVVTAILYDVPHGASLLAGGTIAALSLLWLRQAVDAIIFYDPKRSKRRILGGFFLRLLLIPLCLYAMMRFLFLSIPAAVAGFALFNCSVLVEGILEAFEGSPK